MESFTLRHILKETSTQDRCVCSERGVDVPVEFVEVWDISGLLSLLEVDWVLGWTWIAWSCWGIPAPGENRRHSAATVKHQTPLTGLPVDAVGVARAELVVEEEEGGVVTSVVRCKIMSHAV